MILKINPKKSAGSGKHIRWTNQINRTNGTSKTNNLKVCDRFSPVLQPPTKTHTYSESEKLDLFGYWKLFYEASL